MTSTVIDGGNLASINNPSAVVLNASTELDFNSMDFDATDSYAKTTQEEEGSLNSKTRSRTDASPENESKSVSKSIAKDEELIDDLEEIFDAPPPITTDFTFGLHSETKGEDVVYEDAVSEEVAGEDDAGDVSAALNNADEKVPCTMDAESFTQWRSSFETMTPSDRKEFERLISKYKLPHSPNSA